MRCNKKVGIVTGTRADYGLLKPLIKKIDNMYDAKIIVTGMHLSPEFGLTYKLIENDGIRIDEKIEILLSSDTSIGISKSIGLAVISFSEALSRLDLDCLIILGDRYEVFASAIAATLTHIPIIHLYGGETTQGAYDEVFRHSITKMSHLHFTSTEEYRRRVIQLGENPERVFNVGALGIDNIKNLKLLTKIELEKSINFKLDKSYGLVTFHPTTLENISSEEQVMELIKAIEYFKDMKFIITKSNSDSDGRIINKLFEELEKRESNRIKLFASMGQIRYLSTMKYSDIVIGNSSSGIVEAPTFGIPTINIGDRQLGRIQADSIINCSPIYCEIVDKINKNRNKEFTQKLKNLVNPYGDGMSLERIVKVVDEFVNNPINIKKKFYDIDLKKYL